MKSVYFITKKYVRLTFGIILGLFLFFNPKSFAVEWKVPFNYEVLEENDKYFVFEESEPFSDHSKMIHAIKKCKSKYDLSLAEIFRLTPYIAYTSNTPKSIIYNIIKRAKQIAEAYAKIKKEDIQIAIKDYLFKTIDDKEILKESGSWTGFIGSNGNRILNIVENFRKDRDSYRTALFYWGSQFIRNFLTFKIRELQEPERTDLLIKINKVLSEDYKWRIDIEKFLDQRWNRKGSCRYDQFSCWDLGFFSTYGFGRYFMSSRDQTEKINVFLGDDAHNRERERRADSFNTDTSSWIERLTMDEKIYIDLLGGYKKIASGISLFKVNDKMKSGRNFKRLFEVADFWNFPIENNISGTTERYLTLGCILGFFNEVDLKKISLAAMIEMLPPRHHTFPEIYLARKSFFIYSPLDPTFYKNLYNQNFTDKIVIEMERKNLKLPDELLLREEC